MTAIGSNRTVFQLNEANYKLLLKVKDKAAFVKKADINGDKTVTDDEMAKITLSPEEISDKEQLTYTDEQGTVSLPSSWDEYKKTQLDIQQNTVFGPKNKTSNAEVKVKAEKNDGADAIYGTAKKTYTDQQIATSLWWLSIDKKKLSVEEIESSGVRALVQEMIEKGAFTWKNIQALLAGEKVKVGDTEIQLSGKDNEKKLEVMKKIFRQDDWWDGPGWTEAAFKATFGRSEYGDAEGSMKVNSVQELVEMAENVEAWNTNSTLKKNMGYPEYRLYQTYDRFLAREENDAEAHAEIVEMGKVIAEREGTYPEDMDGDGAVRTDNDYYLVVIHELLKNPPEVVNSIFKSDGRIDRDALRMLLGLPPKVRKADTKKTDTKNGADVQNNSGTDVDGVNKADTVSNDSTEKASEGDMEFVMAPEMGMNIRISKKKVDQLIAANTAWFAEQGVTDAAEKRHLIVKSLIVKALKAQIIKTKGPDGKSIGAEVNADTLKAYFAVTMAGKSIDGIPAAEVYYRYLIEVLNDPAQLDTPFSQFKDAIVQDLKREKGLITTDDTTVKKNDKTVSEKTTDKKDDTATAKKDAIQWRPLADENLRKLDPSVNYVLSAVDGTGKRVKLEEGSTFEVEMDMSNYKPGVIGSKPSIKEYYLPTDTDKKELFWHVKITVPAKNGSEARTLDAYLYLGDKIAVSGEHLIRTMPVVAAGNAFKLKDGKMKDFGSGKVKAGMQVNVECDWNGELVIYRSQGKAYVKLMAKGEPLYVPAGCIGKDKTSKQAETVKEKETVVPETKKDNKEIKNNKKTSGTVDGGDKVKETKAVQKDDTTVKTVTSKENERYTEKLCDLISKKSVSADIVSIAREYYKYIEDSKKRNPKLTAGQSNQIRGQFRKKAEKYFITVIDDMNKGKIYDTDKTLTQAGISNSGDRDVVQAFLSEFGQSVKK